MDQPYRIFGSEMSPYSVKIRAYFRYKGIPHQWLARRQHEDEFQKFARLPIVPLVVTPEGDGIQDSTPIMEKLDTLFPDPSIHPDDPALAFLSALIEEYGDEWGNKLMFHFRWWHERDQHAVSYALARGMSPDGDTAEVDKITAMVRERMTGRGHFVGSSAATAPLIDGYFDRLLAILEPHLEGRKYLLGGRPAFADFGLASQLYEMALDPTAGGIIRARAPNVMAWAMRMMEPHDDGPFEDWDALRPTLEPLLADAGAHFLPWSTANASALMAEQEEFSVELGGATYTQKPQKYHARSLKVLRERYAAVADKAALDPILEKAGCLAYLT